MESGTTSKRKRSTEESCSTLKRKSSTMGFCPWIAVELMLKEIQKGCSKNIVSSPLSINAVLNMLVAGSTGDTLKQMLGFLGSEDIDGINSESRKIMGVAVGGINPESSNGGPILTMVNGVWVDQCCPLVPKYKKEILKGIFKCEVENVDFTTKANEMVDKINSWAKTASKGLIQGILQHGSIDSNTVLILANALYFKGIWKSDYKFDARRTEERKFYLLDRSSVLVPFMTSSKKYYYGSFDGFKVLKVPYQSGETREFAMYFILPNKQDGLENLLKKFDSYSGFLNQVNLKLTKEQLDELWIPKFKFSFDFDVSKVMADMGESLSFIENPLDLSEMMHNTEHIPYFTTKIAQKAYIEVDEKGTEAAAVTRGTCGLGCGASSRRTKSNRFVADHPFMFMISEEGSGLDFFIGAVLNPIKSD